MPEEPKGEAPQFDNNLQNVGQQPVVPQNSSLNPIPTPDSTPAYKPIQPQTVTSESDKQPVADLQSDDPQWQGKLLQPIHSDLKLPPDLSIRPVIQTAPAQPLRPPNPFATPTTEPPVTVETVFPQPPIVLSPRKSKKKLVIGLVILFVVLLIGGTASAYQFWYQNPQKVITDAFINTVNAKSSIFKGTLKIDSKTEGDNNIKTTIDITTKQSDESTFSLESKITISVMGKSFSLKGAVQTDTSGNIYAKFDDLADLVTEAKGLIELSSEGALDQYPKTTVALDSFVGKIDGQWIKISSEDINNIALYGDEISDAQTCTSDVINKYKNDKTAINEITDLYKENQFYAVKKDLGESKGRFGYEIKGDTAKLKSFIGGLQDTKVYKSLHECDSDFTIDANDIPADSEMDGIGTVSIWVDKWTHRLTKIDATGEDESFKSSLTISPQYDTEVKISVPATSITLEQLKTYIDDLTAAYQQDSQIMYENFSNSSVDY